MAGLTVPTTTLRAPTPGRYSITTPTVPAHPTFLASQEVTAGGVTTAPLTGRMTVGPDKIGPAQLGQYRGKRVSPSQPSPLRLVERNVGP